jgi:hypothetical protein
MRHALANVALTVLVGGCSLIYNPSNIDSNKHDAAVDVMADAAIDANATELTLTSVDTPPLLEGQGDGGSRPAVLVVEGLNILSTATITVMPASGTAMVSTVGMPVISTDSTIIAIPVVAMVDKTLPSTTTVPLTVTVTQNTASGMVSKTISWSLQGLDELDVTGNATITTSPSVLDYSEVNVTGQLLHSGTDKIVVHAQASIVIGGSVDVSASGSTAGPGGGAGGGTQAEGGGPGKGKAGSNSAGGGGAGFVIAGMDGHSNNGSGGAMVGDALISSYLSNQGSGGGGAAAVGGGGGGTIELTAGGTLTVHQISSNGASGTGGLLTGGGGGSGGVIVLRSGVMATIGGVLSVAPGTGGTGTLALGAGNGGDGRDGRIRFDAPVITGSGSSNAAAHRGAMFDPTAPAIVHTPTPTVTVIGSMTDMFDMYVTSPTLQGASAPLTINFGAGTMVTTQTPQLTRGLHQVCVVPMGSNIGIPESRNCIEVAYLP